MAGVLVVTPMSAAAATARACGNVTGMGHPIMRQSLRSPCRCRRLAQLWVLGVTRLDRSLSIVAMMVMMMLHVALRSVLIV
ncbi:MAG TPA: hypothetical protein VFS51_03445 [Gemmatimonadales bacterium]|nr:hypothetical protein [Gemmatimonadales bacterium]